MSYSISAKEKQHSSNRRGSDGKTSALPRKTIFVVMLFFSATLLLSACRAQAPDNPYSKGPTTAPYVEGPNSSPPNEQ